MKDLIEALTILLKYGDPAYPTNCSHDVLWVNVDPALVTGADKARLNALGFSPDDGGFRSYKFGSC